VATTAVKTAAPRAEFHAFMVVPPEC